MKLLGGAQDDVRNLGLDVNTDGVTITEFQQRSSLLQCDIPQYHGIALIGIIGFYDLVTERLIAHAHTEGFGNDVFVFSALKFVADTLHGTFSVNQQQLSGRKNMFVDSVGYVDIDNDDSRLLQHHRNKHIRYKQFPCHDGQLDIEHQVRP